MARYLGSVSMKFYLPNFCMLMRHFFWHASAGAHHFHHFAHLGVLFEEVVPLLDGGAGAGGYAVAAAAVDDAGVRHGLGRGGGGGLGGGGTGRGRGGQPARVSFAGLMLSRDDVAERPGFASGPCAFDRWALRSRPGWTGRVPG